MPTVDEMLNEMYISNVKKMYEEFKKNEELERKEREEERKREELEKYGHPDVAFAIRWNERNRNGKI